MTRVMSVCSSFLTWGLFSLLSEHYMYALKYCVQWLQSMLQLFQGNSEYSQSIVDPFRLLALVISLMALYIFFYIWFNVGTFIVVGSTLEFTLLLVDFGSSLLHSTY